MSFIQKSELEAHLRADWKTVHNLWANIKGLTGGSGTVTPGVSGAPLDASYILQQTEPLLPEAQTLGTLATGILKNTAGTGVLVIAGAISEKTDNYVVLTSDFWNMLLMNSASAKIFTLPAIAVVNISASITLVKRGEGKLTIQAGGTDKIHDSSPGGTLYNDLTYAADKEFSPLVRLRVVAAGEWIIEFSTGSGWRTS